jgi:hypothetical protein
MNEGAANQSTRPVALVTGATSGIGAAFARRLARDGYDLVVTGRRQAALDSLAAEVREAHRVDVTVIVAELSDAGQAERLAAYIGAHPEIQLLVNNAGFGTRQGLLDGAYEDHEAMLDVHVRVPMRLCRAALPAMVARGAGAVINVSSLASFFPLPDGAVYAATKAALRILSEGLFMTVGHRGVRVQALCPGFVYTDFHRRIGIADEERKNRGILRWMHADRVVAVSLRSLARGKAVCVPGFLNRVVRFAGALVPRGLYYRLSSKLRHATDRR